MLLVFYGQMRDVGYAHVRSQKTCSTFTSWIVELFFLRLVFCGQMSDVGYANVRSLKTCYTFTSWIVDVVLLLVVVERRLAMGALRRKMACVLHSILLFG